MFVLWIHVDSNTLGFLNGSGCIKSPQTEQDTSYICHFSIQPDKITRTNLTDRRTYKSWGVGSIHEYNTDFPPFIVSLSQILFFNLSLIPDRGSPYHGFTSPHPLRLTVPVPPSPHLPPPEFPSYRRSSSCSCRGTA